MHISDWSSDVCCSDLLIEAVGGVAPTYGSVEQHRRMGRAKRNPSPRDAWLRAGRWVSLRSTHPARSEESVAHPSPVFEGRGPLRQQRGRVHLSEKRTRPVTLILFSNRRSEEHTSELQSLMSISYAV